MIILFTANQPLVLLKPYSPFGLVTISFTVNIISYVNWYIRQLSPDPKIPMRINSKSHNETLRCNIQNRICENCKNDTGQVVLKNLITL